MPDMINLGPVGNQTPGNYISDAAPTPEPNTMARPLAPVFGAATVAMTPVDPMASCFVLFSTTMHAVSIGLHINRWIGINTY